MHTRAQHVKTVTLKPRDPAGTMKPPSGYEHVSEAKMQEYKLLAKHKVEQAFSADVSLAEKQRRVSALKSLFACRAASDCASLCFVASRSARSRSFSSAIALSSVIYPVCPAPRRPVVTRR